MQLYTAKLKKKIVFQGKSNDYFVEDYGDLIKQITHLNKNDCEQFYEVVMSFENILSYFKKEIKKCFEYKEWKYISFKDIIIEIEFHEIRADGIIVPSVCSLSRRGYGIED